MRRLLLLSLAALAVAGCATSGAFRSGENAERLQDYDRAVLEYQKAVQGAPDNVQYRRALERARLRAATDHTNMARRLSGRGLYTEALNEYRLALELHPNAPGVVGKSPDVVVPVTYALPALSTAMPAPESLPPPPRKVA